MVAGRVEEALVFRKYSGILRGAGRNPVAK